ncbi:MAG TPA: DUF4012 domain-containing protein [Acidimicrobiales bacterium]|nr:DUF4012 domain-containing protein [Acidimicrobiales bacterium]
MATDAALLGVAIIFTLLAAASLSLYERVADRRKFRFRRFERPGATALIIGFSIAALVTGKLGQSWFVLPAAGFAALSGTVLLRRGGRLRSFLSLWAMAAVVVLCLGAQIPAYGVRAVDIVFTGLFLACFTSLIRELDIFGPIGWFAGLGAATGTAAVAYAAHSTKDEGVAVLVAGATFAVAAVSPFASGMLGRMGSRLAGLVIGGLAVRSAVGSPLGMAIVVAVGVVCAVAYIATFESPERGRVILGVVALAGATLLAAVPAVMALLDVYRPIHHAVATSRALVKADAGELTTTDTQLGALQDTFAHSAARLNKAAVTIGRAVPFLSANLSAAKTSAQVASDLAGSARRLIVQVNVNAASVRQATVDRSALKNLTSGLQVVQKDVGRAERQLGSGDDSELLVPELRTGVADLRAQVHSVNHRVSTSLQGARVADTLLGFDRPRRYFIAVQNNAESRATGGYIANYGILMADHGHITLPQFRRTSEFDAKGAPHRTLHAPKDYLRRYSRFDVDREWTNVNMSPDLPTVAKIIADQYRQFSGTKVDGVITVDPVALAGLLRLTGPVRVADWPVPITADNVVKITLHDEYIAFDNQLDNRIDFLGTVAKTVFDRLTNGGLVNLVQAGNVIHDATATRHLQVWSAEPAAQRFFVATRAAGAIGALRGDALMVTTQNAAGNKLDYYLHRSITYDATVSTVDGRRRVDATLTVALRNDAPDGGEPKYVIGPFDSRFKAGQNRLFVTVYSPLVASAATIDGDPLEVQGAPEFGRFAQSAFVDVPPGTTRTLVFRLGGVIRDGDRYRLDIVRQPLMYDDALSLHLGGVTRRGLRENGPLSHDIHLEIPYSGS